MRQTLAVIMMSVCGWVTAHQRARHAAISIEQHGEIDPISFAKAGAKTAEGFRRRDVNGFFDQTTGPVTRANKTWSLESTQVPPIFPVIQSPGSDLGQNGST